MPPARGRRSALFPRVASAVVLIPMALAAVWFGAPYLSGLAVAAGLGMAWEWGRLSATRRLDPGATAVIATVVAAAIAAADRHFALGGGIAVGGATLAAMARRRERVWTGLGTAWIALGIVAFLWLDLPPQGGRATLFWLLGVVWASDVFAYFVGRAVGGPRLAPTWSPNKTWAGFAGGLAGAIGIGVAAGFAGSVSLAFTVPLSAVLGLAAQAGDLAESAAKRHFLVKDTGRLIPGHGGILDRLDGLLAAAIVAALIALFLSRGALEIG
jgi:phosphatidate cytidylyltransferase